MRAVFVRDKIAFVLLAVALFVPVIIIEWKAGLLSGWLIFLAVLRMLEKFLDREPWSKLLLRHIAPMQSWKYLGLAAGLNCCVTAWAAYTSTILAYMSWFEITSMTFWFLISLAISISAAAVALMSD